MLFGEDAENKEKERVQRPPRDFGSRPDYSRRTPSDHPLSQQFRRERQGNWQSKGPRFNKKPRTGGY